MIKVIYEDNHLIVVEKPINVAVQEDSSKDIDFLSMLKKFIKDKYNKPGNVYLGLVHRLDRPVGGIMVFGKTSKASSRLSKQISDRKFGKTYYAVVEGKINENGTLEDYLLKDSKTNVVKVDKNGKKAILHYERADYKKGYSLVKVKLETGRSHQIRVQLSNAGHPIFGDQKYNKNAIAHTQIALFASSITFEHPVTKDIMTFDASLPTRRPWNIFNKGEENAEEK